MKRRMPPTTDLERRSARTGSPPNALQRKVPPSFSCTGAMNLPAPKRKPSPPASSSKFCSPKWPRPAHPRTHPSDGLKSATQISAVDHSLTLPPSALHHCPLRTHQTSYLLRSAFKHHASHRKPTRLLLDISLKRFLSLEKRPPKARYNDS